MPSRIIRDSARTSPTLDQLSDGAERLFWRLTTVADDKGRFEADPRLLLASCFPLKVEVLKVATVADWFAELVGVGLVQVYEVAGRLYAAFLTWAKYQRVRKYGSKFPEPPAVESPEAQQTQYAAYRGTSPHHADHDGAERPGVWGIERKNVPPHAAAKGMHAGDEQTAAAADPDLDHGDTGQANGGGGQHVHIKLQEAIRSLSVPGFHCLAEDTRELEVYWDALLDVIRGQGQHYLTVLRGVNAYYAGLPARWPKSLDEARRAMEYGVKVTLGLIEPRKAVRHA